MNSNTLFLIFALYASIRLLAAEQKYKRNIDLVMAVKLRRHARVLQLLEQGANPNANENVLDRPGFWDFIKQRIGHPRSLKLGTLNPAGSSVVALAIAQDDTKSAIALLAYGARDVNAIVEIPDSTNNTLLECECRNPNPILVSMLLAHGAKPEYQGTEDESPLLATILWSPELRMHDGNLDSMRERRCIEIVTLLLKRGSKANTCCETGTPLNEAIIHDQAEIVKLLVAHGANVNLPDDRGKLPLQLAMYTNKISIVQCLLEHGAKVNKKDQEGFTPLHLARGRVSLGYGKEMARKIIHLLKKYGATE